MVCRKNNTDYKLKRVVYIILFLAAVVVAPAYSQKPRVREETPPLKERLFFGGSFGLQLGTITNIEASPIVGLWILPRLTVAAGPDYIFYKDPLNRTDIYGGSAYTQFYFIKDINSMIPLGVHLGFFLHAEDELLSLQSSFWKSTPYPSDRFFLNTVLAGGGFSQPMGRRSSLNMMFLFALNESVYDLYGKPEIRLSLIF